LDILKGDKLLLFVLCWFVAFPEPFIFVDLCCSETLLHPQTIMFKTEVPESLKSEENTYPILKKSDIIYIIRCRLNFLFSISGLLPHMPCS
jgi:hypothetical protein